MGNNIGEIGERLQYAAAALGPIGVAEIDGETAITHPHVELIDFDQLRRTLVEATEAMEAAEKQTRDIDVVKRWLTCRITALKRGRQVLLNETVTGKDAGHGDDISAAELLHRFEEETARWRMTTTDRRDGCAFQPGRRNRDYLAFKS